MGSVVRRETLDAWKADHRATGRARARGVLHL